MFSPFDQEMMQRALGLAARGRFTNHPNPRVGCVIAQGERVVGEGWHRKWGEPHAEALALQQAGAGARGATAYVTLEPHCFHGRTPPCTDALIRAGIQRVVCGALDPNPKVHGQGIRQLRDSGVQVQTGLLEREARDLNRGFEKRMLTGTPRVIVKTACSLDGRVALANGASKWITSAESRADVQRLRAECSAVLTGIETVLADDPQLNVRDPAIEMLGRQPLRVVLDTKLRMPPSARMLKCEGETIVFSAAAQSDRAAALAAAGATVLDAGVDGDGRLALAVVLSQLGELQCNDVLVEAGPTLTGRFLQLGLVDQLIVYVAPVLLGPEARAMAGLPQLDRLEDALRLKLERSEQTGPDLKLVLSPTVAHS